MKKRFMGLFILLLAVLLSASTLAEEQVFDATADLAAMAQGEKQDGDTLLVNDFFTIHFSMIWRLFRCSCERN